MRTCRRVSIQCPIYYSNGQLVGAGTAWNLSVTGWRVTGNYPLELGATVSLLAVLPDSSEGVVVDQAIVRWSRGQEFGLEIQQIQAEYESHLRKFVVSQI